MALIKGPNTCAEAGIIGHVCRFCRSNGLAFQVSILRAGAAAMAGFGGADRGSRAIDMSLSKEEARVAKRVLLVKGHNGLGNRILSVMCGLLYARLSKRELMVDWSDSIYSEDGSNVFRRLFQCPALLGCDDFASIGDSVYPAIWRGHLEESAQAMAERHRYDPDDARRELSIDVRRLDYDEKVVVLTGFADQIEVLKERYQGLLPELDNLERPQLMAKLLAEQLIPCLEVRSRVDDFKDTYFVGRTIGVHIRFSDHRIRLLGLLRQLNALLNQEPDLQVFVATDNEAVLRLIQRHYANVITAPHWYDQRGAALHYSQSNRDRMEGAIDALADLYLLADCDHLIVDTTSSFSLLASVLSKAGAGRIRVLRSGAIGLGFLGSKAMRRTRRMITGLLLRSGALTWGMRAFAAVAPIRKL